MNEAIDWINTNEGVIRTGLTVFYFLMTLIMVWATLGAVRIGESTLKEMQAAHSEEMRPEVIFDIVFEGEDVDFRVKNYGRTAARNLRLSIEPNLLIRAGWTSSNRDTEKDPYRFSDLSMFRSGIEMLGPDEDYSEHVDVAFRFFKRNEERRIRGAISYEDQAGNPYRFDIDLDLAPYADRGFIVTNEVDELIKHLDRLKRHFAHKMH